MATITLSPSFFIKELQAYSDWRSAFWRELVQNSVDAGASKIWITFQEEAGLRRVSFLDDAGGMDLNTLEHVYFVVGETSKTGTDSIGGFGRAHILTCFAHRSWKIATKEWVCSGSGTQYEIAQSEKKQDGCLVQVVIGLASMDEMEYALDCYLKTCQLACEVRVNGKHFKEWAHRNRLAGQLSFGRVFLNKSKARYSVLVRVNGVHMFSRYTQAAWQIVIEIYPDRNRRVLTSNRDGLTCAAARELDDFIGSVWVSPSSAVRCRQQRFREDGDVPVYRVRGKKSRTTDDEEENTEKPELVQEAVSRVACLRPSLRGAYDVEQLLCSCLWPEETRADRLRSIGRVQQPAAPGRRRGFSPGEHWRHQVQAPRKVDRCVHDRGRGIRGAGGGLLCVSNRIYFR
jgi:hypothetical protein